jgi:hypothetical protein
MKHHLSFSATKEGARMMGGVSSFVTDVIGISLFDCFAIAGFLVEVPFSQALHDFMPTQF